VQIPRNPAHQPIGEMLADFGLQPVSNRFLPSGSSIAAPAYPLALCVDPATGLVHLRDPFPVDELRPRYDWLTCYEPEEHLDDLATRLIRLPNITKASNFGAYSFKDDSMLRRLEQRGYGKNWRIDPALDLGVSDPCANVETYQSVMTPEKAEEMRSRRGAADVLIVRHVVEHAYDLHVFIDSLKRLVSPGGYIAWELPDCERSLEEGDCTTLWEEHLFYFTSFTFRQILLQAGFEIVHFESVPYPLDNSLVAIVREASAERRAIVADAGAVSLEIARARKFAHAVARRKSIVRETLGRIRKKHGPLAMFGAGHLSVAFLSLMQVSDLFSCILDDNPNKKGLQMPVGGLEIVGSDALYSSDIGVCVLGLNPQNQPKVIAKHKPFTAKGGVFASIFPGLELDLEQIG
jgi:hypothetical protein